MEFSGADTYMDTDDSESSSGSVTPTGYASATSTFEDDYVQIPGGSESFPSPRSRARSNTTDISTPNLASTVKPGCTSTGGSTDDT